MKVVFQKRYFLFCVFLSGCFRLGVEPWASHDGSIDGDVDSGSDMDADGDIAFDADEDIEREIDADDGDLDATVETGCTEDLDMPPEGTGTADDPYRLCSSAQFIGSLTQVENLDASFILMVDLDLEGVAFDGIGSVEAPFSGHIDGNGRTISNLDVTATAGQPAGFVNVAREARLDDLALANITVVGTEHVGAVVGECDRSQVHGVVVTSAAVRGEVAVGGIVGEAMECQLFDASLTGEVEGTVEAIGGIVGLAGNSVFLNIDAVIDVNAPIADIVGGVVGYDVWSPVILQKVSVQGSVVGDHAVGGIMGSNSDGSLIYRTHFEGTVHGNIAVGGFVGENLDWPFYVYATSVVADVIGNDGVGGFSGHHYYRSRFFDSFFRGTLTSVEPVQANFGGFFGDVEYYGWVERSYVDVTIDSLASNVGGLVGHIGYWSSNSAIYDVVDSFSAADATGSSPSATISLWVGQNTDPNPLLGAGSYYWAGGSCVNLGGGGCGGGGNAVSDLSELQDPGGQPLASWDFEHVWQQSESGGFPTLRLEQHDAPTLTSACPRDAIVGLLYQCELAISDADLNELRLAVLEASNSCDWLTPSLGYNGVNTLHGMPSADHLDSCTAEFSVTDGAHTTPVQIVPIDIHAGVIVTPASSSRTSYSMGFQQIGTVATQVFTLTNQESVAIEFSIEGLPNGDFAFAGSAYPGTDGTCGATLGAGETCTIAISYAPTVAGSVSAPIEIRFTNARGLVSYTFTLSGNGRVG